MAVRSPAAAQAAQQAMEALRNRLDGLVVDEREQHGGQIFVTSRSGFLTGANGEDRAVPPARAQRFPAAEPHRPVKAFLEEYAALFGHDSRALDAAIVKRDVTGARNGLRTMVWEQYLDGLPVFEAALIAHTTRRGELVNVCSRMLADLNAAAEAGTPQRAKAITQPAVTPAKAITAAAATLSIPIDSTQIAAATSSAGTEKRQRFEAPGLLGQIEVALTWLPMDRQSLRLCWDLQLTSSTRGEMFRFLIDALTGEPLVRRCLTDYLTDASYRVYTGDSPTPFSPAYDEPIMIQPPGVARTLVTWGALDTNASPNGWINDGDNSTLGNNVDAHLDRNKDNVPDPGSRPTGSPYRVFDFPLSLSKEPVAYTNASVVQAFYWCNWMHDKLYQLGFTEAGGNFQSNCFNRGGLFNDAVIVDVQDGYGFNNANMSTPSDGTPPRMQLYIYNMMQPDRDSALDAEIVLHEYTHGLSRRTVGGGIFASGIQFGGLCEGWSDFYAFAMLSEPSDDAQGNWCHAAYCAARPGTANFNYYYGNRRYPCTTDMGRNPLTFKDIDPSQADAHAGVPRNPNVANVPDEIHAMGEVWSVTLWDVRANLIAKHGFTGNWLCLELLTDGMRLAPPNPNYLQARDAIIQADLVNNAGANSHELWAAFAKRGMGYSACAPGGGIVGLVETFDLPDDLKVTPPAHFSSIGQRGGPFNPASAIYTLSNSGPTEIVWTATQTQTWFTVSPGGGTLGAGEAIPISVTLNSEAAGLPGGVYGDCLGFSNLTSGVAPIRAIRLRAGDSASLPFTETFEGGALQHWWTVTGTGPYRSLVTGGNTPHYGVYHLCMDSGTDYTFARNEVTLTVDLAGWTNVVLSFWAKSLHDEPQGPPPTPFFGGADFDGVAISQDGNTWYEVKSLRSLTNWYASQTVVLDTALASQGLAYGSNFHIRFNQYGNYPMTADGIAIDDISITGTPSIIVWCPAAASETAGTLAGQGHVGLSSVPDADVAVTLTSSDTSEVTVASSMTIPAGQTNGTFDITILDDSDLDGTRVVTLSASAQNVGKATAAISVHDSETASLSLMLPDSVTEGMGAGAGQVSVSAPVATPVSVRLTPNIANELTIPTTVTIPEGQSSANFTVTAVNDSRLDGPCSVTVTAHVENWTDGSASITVLDNENVNLTLALPGFASEGAGVLAGAGYVGINGTLSTNLMVSLSSGDPSELTVPATVTVPAGQIFAVFDVTIADDLQTDGAQPVTVTAGAGGFSGAAATMIVRDNELHHFGWSHIPSPQGSDIPFGVVLSALDVNGATISVWSGTATLAGTGDGGSVALSPDQTTAFSDGVWSGNVRVHTRDTNVRLTASDADGHSTESNPFDVQGGPLHHFAWTLAAPPIYAGIPFPVTITAQDAANNTVTSFEGTVAIFDPPVVQRLIGDGPFNFIYPFNTARHDARTQVIYLKNELGAAAALTSLGLNVDIVPGHTMTNFTIRMKHTSLAGFPSAIWETNNWTTVYRANRTIGSTGWVDFPFTTAFSYNGISNLMVDFSFDTSVGTTSGRTRDTTTGGWRCVYGYSDSNDGDPLNWAGTSNPTPSFMPRAQNIIFRTSGGTPLMPTNSGSFVGGAWDGSLMALEPSLHVAPVAADQDGHTGTGNVFAVEAAADLAIATADFPDPVWLGSNLAYVVTVTNLGPCAATGIIVTNLLPLTTPLGSIQASQGTWSQTDEAIIWSLGDLAKYQYAALNLNVTPGAGGLMTNRAHLTALLMDPVQTNNTALCFTMVLRDADGDDMEDGWEIIHELNPDDPTDAFLDPDGDGLSNVDEYRANTDPNNRLSCFTMASIAIVNGHAVIRFSASSQRTYQIEFSTDLFHWEPLPEGVVSGMDGMVEVEDTEGDLHPRRFYRARTCP